MPASSESKSKKRRLSVAYDVVLVPRNGKAANGEVIGTLENGAAGPKFVFRQDHETSMVVLDTPVLIESFGSFKRVLEAATEWDQQPVKAATTLSGEEKAKALLSEVSKALTELAASQENFRAELVAAYEEGEELFKLAAG